MKLMIDIPDRIHYGIEKGITVNGSEASQIVLDAVKNGTPLRECMEELKRQLLMEVDGGTDDKCLRYTDVCDRISDTIDTYIKAESGDNEFITNQEWLSHIFPEVWVRVIHWLYHDYGTRFADSEGAIIQWLQQDMRKEQTFEVLQPCTESLPPFWFRKEQT